MICDSHIHVGQFYEKNTTPQRIIELTKFLKIDRYAVSSTTICAGEHTKVLKELEYLLSHDGKRCDPILWLIPSLLKNRDSLDEFLNYGISWKCIKIHPELHPYEWINGSQSFDEVLHLAKTLDIPILIHTGGFEYSEMGLWNDTVTKNPQQIFIFAHCRPIDQAIKILQNHKNVYGDLAFVDDSEFKKLIYLGLSDKILWGSDMPINEYFIPEITTKSYYNKRLNILKNVSTKEQFENICQNNYFKIFKI